MGLETFGLQAIFLNQSDRSFVAFNGRSSTTTTDFTKENVLTA